MLGNGALFKVKGRDSKYRRGEGSQVEHIKPCRSHGGGLGLDDRLDRHAWVVSRRLARNNVGEGDA
jgi:hypothetical protein